MYFRNLVNLREKRYSDLEIKTLDEWLVRSPYRNRENLNPLKFSLDSGIWEERSVELFFSATEEEVKVLEFYIDVVTSDRMTVLGTFKSLSEIPPSIVNPETNEMIQVNDRNIEISFKLIDFPSSLPEVKSVQKDKKVQNLQLSGINTYNHCDDIRKYLN